MTSDDLSRIPPSQRERWFAECFNLAAAQILDCLSEDFISPQGKEVADIGCGDGIIDLGIALRARPSRLVGFDVIATDTAALAEIAAQNGLAPELPAWLEFQSCLPDRLPAPDASFDLALSWSAFHHFDNPQSMVSEIARVLRPGGWLMIQVYPFYSSQHGSLLQPWFPQGFAQFEHQPEEIDRIVRSDPGPDPSWAEAMLQANRRLNRLTVDDLGRMLLVGGFTVQRLDLIAEDTAVSPAAAKLPLSQLGIGGLKLLARRSGTPQRP